MKISQKISQWWKEINKCQTPRCENAAEIFGVCDKCLEKDFIRADMEYKKREHNKLKAAIKEALLEIQAEEKA